MVRNRSVRVAVCLLAMTWLSTPSRADNFFGEEYDSDLAHQSAFLRWMAGTELAGRAAPIGIANKPCYVYDGPRLVVFPCPGTVTYQSAAEPTVVDSAPLVPGCGYRYRVHYRPGVACISRRY
jgi:hypothetical protein